MAPKPTTIMSIDDRTLLEKAAIAAGMADAQWQDMRGWGEARYGFSQAIWSEAYGDYWNPLDSDAQAMRLSMALFIQLNFGGRSTTGPAEVWASYPNPKPYGMPRRLSLQVEYLPEEIFQATRDGLEMGNHYMRNYPGKYVRGLAPATRRAIVRAAAAMADAAHAQDRGG